MTDVVVIGDSLLDRDWTGLADRLCPDAAAPVVDVVDEVVRAGGAALTASIASAQGAAVALVTALGDDNAGHEVKAKLGAAGVELVDLHLLGPTPEKGRVRVNGTSLLRLDRDCRGLWPVGPWIDEATARIAAADAVVVSDYGRGLTGLPQVRRSIERFGRRRPVVWDPHRSQPRPGKGTSIATPNEDEASAAFGSRASPNRRAADLWQLAEQLALRWQCSVLMTCGSRGAVHAIPGQSGISIPALPADGDACGAGDCLAASLAVSLGRGIDQATAVRTAVVAASDFVAGRHRSAIGIVRRTRAQRGRVVVTGGCFDVLHAGHVALLQHARALGDCLVVCLNSDRSVRQLKGPGRPVNSAADRAAILLGLAGVDAVEVFDEPTPVEALRLLRPDIFVKGADYEPDALPEAAVLGEWGGVVQLLPLVPGRSTTRILRVAAAAGG